MPGMVAFGRRWSIATDDFIVIGIIDTIFFLGWLCWSAVMYWAFLTTDECNCQSDTLCIFLHAFLAGSWCSYLLNLILAINFIIFSTRGTVSDFQARRHVVKLVYVKFFLSLLDLVWAILGSLLISQDFSCGDFHAEFIIKILTGCFWFMAIGRCGMIWMFYDSKGGKKKSPLRQVINNEYFNYSVAAGSARKWRFRLQTLCFWCIVPSKDKEVAINTISQLLAFLAYDLDIVVSDLIASFILYKRKCFAKYKTTEAALETTPVITLRDGTSSDVFPTSDFLPWMNLKLASHYFKVGTGILGWPWTMYRYFPRGLCILWSYIRCCFYCRKSSQRIVSDNCCGCNLAALYVASGYEYEDLIHVSFENRVYQIPYFVAIDEKTSSIILATRGTMSCSDALLDLSSSFSPMEDEGLSKDVLCHGGMLLAARRIKSKLESQEILQKAFEGRENYTLVLTGHSLGAAVASILTLMLQKTYPNIRCYAFAPPPIFNEVAAKQTKNTCFTVIFGNDVTPFMNYHNVRELLIRSTSLLNQCKLPKYKILMGCFKSKEEENFSSAPVISINDTSQSSENIISDEEKVTYEKIENGVDSDNEPIILTPSPKTKFYIPGKILHIRPSNFGYRLHISDHQDYTPIVFCPEMFFHHFPNFMEICLKQLGENEILKLKQGEATESNET